MKRELATMLMTLMLTLCLCYQGVSAIRAGLVYGLMPPDLLLALRQSCLEGGDPLPQPDLPFACHGLAVCRRDMA